MMVLCKACICLIMEADKERKKEKEKKPPTLKDKSKVRGDFWHNFH